MNIRNIRNINTATEGDFQEFPRRAISSHDEETEANDVFEDDVSGELVSQPRNEPSSSLRRSQAQRLHQEAVNTNMQGYILSWNNLSVKRGQKVILDNLNGISRPGEITAIMGKWYFVIGIILPYLLYLVALSHGSFNLIKQLPYFPTTRSQWMWKNGK